MEAAEWALHSSNAAFAAACAVGRGGRSPPPPSGEHGPRALGSGGGGSGGAGLGAGGVARELLLEAAGILTDDDITSGGPRARQWCLGGIKGRQNATAEGRFNSSRCWGRSCGAAAQAASGA
jgi:hypothetical protein